MNQVTIGLIRFQSYLNDHTFVYDCCVDDAGSGAVEREAIVRASRVPLTRANVTKTNHHPFQPLPHIQERKEKTGESVQMPFSLTNDLVVSLGRSLTPFNSEKGYSDRYACS